MTKTRTRVESHRCLYTHTHTLKAHSVLSWEVKQKDSRALQAGEERQTRSTHMVYFHLAWGKLSQAQQASGSNFFFFLCVLVVVALLKRAKIAGSNKNSFYYHKAI